MNKILDSLRVKLELNSMERLSHLFNFDAINAARYKTRQDLTDRINRKWKAHQLWVKESSAPKIYNTCQEVLDKIGLEEDIEFYISNNPGVNAYSIRKSSSKSKHIISIFSSMIEKLNKKELKFVIGHEVGHLIYGHQLTIDNVDFIYPDLDKSPEFVKMNYLKWKQLSELSSDRVGLFVSDDLLSAISAMFRIYVGVSRDIMDFKANDFNKLINEIVAEHTEGTIDYKTSHPPIPLRVKALQIFYNSTLYEDISKNKLEREYTIEDELKSEFGDLMGKIFRVPENSWEKAWLNFLSSAGLMVISSDGKIGEGEYRSLKNRISCIIDPALLEDIYEQEKAEVRKKLNESTDFLVRKYPERITSLFHDLVLLSISDYNLSEVEMATLMELGIEKLKLEEDQALDIIRDALRKYYTPFRSM